MATRVLIINRQLVFAVTLKQALEQTGAFDVHPFTAADAAYDYLREHPQDVALVDFALPGRSGARVVQQLRSIQPDLAVIISPRQAEADVRSLRIQGMIDAPFTARAIIPLIHQALDQAPDVTLPDIEDEPPPARPGMTGTSTRLLGGEQPPTPPLTTRLFDQPPAEDEPAQTRNLDERQFGTRQLGEPEDDDDQGWSPLGRGPAQTRILDDENEPDWPGSPAPSQTRMLDEDAPPPPPPMRGTAQTRIFDDDDVPEWPGSPAPWQTRPLDDEAPPPPPGRRPAQTRIFDENDVPLPPAQRSPSAQTRPLDAGETPFDVPESGRLDSVLRSFEFEQQGPEFDTPAVPLSDSDDVRQFIATSDPGLSSETFDDVLEAIDPAEEESRRQRKSAFDGLVASMRNEQPYQPLPNRQQQAMDFILTTGMDDLLQEIKKTQTIPAAPRPETPPEFEDSKSFAKLKQEEPPMPTFEESGTVSDLMSGISDRGFRNVLAILRGDEADLSETGDTGAAADTDLFAGFFAPTDAQETAAKTLEDTSPTQPPGAPAALTDDFSFDVVEGDTSDEESVAHVVLKTALDDVESPEAFSLRQIISDIEMRLSLHNLNVRPLPSWNMDTGAFRPVLEAGVREPDFLPPTLPEFDNLPETFSPTETWEPGYPDYEPPPEATERTTRPSPVAQSEVEPLLEDGLTPLDMSYAQPTMPARRVDEGTEQAEPLAPNWLPEFDEETSAESAQPTQDEWDAWPDEALPAAEADNALPDDFETEALPAGADPLDFTWPGTDEFAAEPVEADESEAPGWMDFAEAEEAPYSEEETQATPAPDEAPSITPAFTEFDEEQVYWDEPVADEAEQWDTADVQPTIPLAAEAEVPAEPISEADAYIAQLALNLTQVSLELSAEGTILSRNGDIIAAAGHLAQDDIQEISRVIDHDWEANADGARVRFVALPAAGKDFMLYSIRTIGDLTLSMIFAGTTPLRVIRQQAQRLAGALQAIPETQAEGKPAPESALAPVVEEISEAIPMTAYTYLWVVRDPNQHLRDTVIQAIRAGLTMQLTERGWSVHSLDVQDDYVYVRADVPGEVSSPQIIRDLQRRSAEIALTQDVTISPQRLWADSYLILTPGRDLTTQEIQDFINFQRM